jgi:cytosine/adenosine deaminase-related metal-dependent hydrolase
VLSPKTVLAHGNYLDDDDIALIAKRGASVAYCPRTHAAFGHDGHPFERLLAAGVNVCVGTDGLASNPSLSVLDELRFVRGRSERVSGATLLEMGTIRGARALGMDREIGSVEVGKAADLCVIPLEAEGASDPVENVLSSPHAPVATFVAGVRVKPFG